MAIQNDAILTVDHILLPVFRRGEPLVDDDITFAVRATLRWRDIDGPIAFGGCFSKPSRMSNGRATFSFGLGIPGHRFDRWGFVVTLLLVRGELALAFKLQFEFDLLQLLLQPLIFFEESRIPFPLRVDRPMQLPEKEFVVVCPQDQLPERRAAQMGAMADVRASVFVVRVEAK